MAAGIPVVETWDLTLTPIDTLVGFSHTSVAEAVCRRLHAGGRRRLAVIGVNGARAAAHGGIPRHGPSLHLRKPAVVQVPSPAMMVSGHSGLRSLLAQDPDIDGVFCSSDLLTLGLMTEAGAGHQGTRTSVHHRFR